MSEISIIMPIYNGSKYIASTIKSVLSQSYSDWELIISDDCSTDNTSNIILEFAKEDKRVKYLKLNKNGGSARARNNSLSVASGRYITFLDADDLWDSNFLENQLSFMKDGDKAMVIGSYRRISDEGGEILTPFIVPKFIDYNGFLKNCCITCLTSIYDTEQMSIEYFDESLGSIRDDYAMWLTQLKKVEVVYGNQDILASYRVFNASVTANKRKLIIPHFNIYYKKEKLGLLKSLLYTINWGLRGIFKYN